jgi:hypothetical protein
MCIFYFLLTKKSTNVSQQTATRKPSHMQPIIHVPNDTQ